MYNCVGTIVPNFLLYFKNDTRNGNHAISFNVSDQAQVGQISF